MTDPDSLKWLGTQPHPRGKFGWWLIEIDELNYEITPRKGLDHVVPDCMSRSRYSEDNEEIQDEEHFLENGIFAVNPIPMNEWIERIKTEQENNSAISFAINQIKNSKVITNGQFKRIMLMHLDNGILMRGKQVVLPNSLRYEVTREFHVQTGHQGEARTMQAVASHYMWKEMRSYIEDFCKHCQCCLVNKASRAPKNHKSVKQ